MQSAEVQQGRSEILLHLILLFALILDSRDQRAAVNDRYVEALHDAQRYKIAFFGIP
jgi:hypothetical protein